MNVEATNPQEAAQQAWDLLDAEDNGTAPRPIPSEKQSPVEDVSAVQAPAQETGKTDNESVANASEQALMDKLAGLESQLGTMAQRLRNAEGHIGGLDSQLKRSLQTANQVAAGGGDAPTAAQIKRAEGDPEAMKNLKRDYPEFATAMQDAMTESMAEFERRLAAQAPTQTQQQTPPVTADDIAQMRRELTVELRHPGWQQTVQTPEFAGWLQRQPREVVMLSTSSDPQDAVRLLDIHAESKKTPVSQEQTQRTQRLSSAAAIPQGRSASRTTQKDWADMSPQEQWRYLDEVEKSKG